MARMMKAAICMLAISGREVPIPEPKKDRFIKVKPAGSVAPTSPGSWRRVPTFPTIRGTSLPKWWTWVRSRWCPLGKGLPSFPSCPAKSAIFAALGVPAL